MPRHLISFDDGAMDHIPAGDLPAVDEASRAVMREAVVGGFCVVEVAAREEALRWAARFAESFRCAQEVRDIMFDPGS